MRKPLDAAAVLRHCEAGTAPVGIDLDAALEANRLATGDLQRLTLAAIIMCRLPDAETLQRQFAALEALPLSNWHPDPIAGLSGAEVREGQLQHMRRPVDEPTGAA